MKIYENIVIGGGASGLMFASNLREKRDTIILENNSKFGAKVLISGGGRCNFTNKRVYAGNYLAKKSFLKEFLKEYPSSVIFDYFISRGLNYTVKNETQFFCKSSSKEILDILINGIKGVKSSLNCKVLSVKKRDDIFEVDTTNGLFLSKNLIVSSGGLSFAKIGATSIGFDIAKEFGHSVNSLNPALVGFTLQPKENFFKELSGVSVDVDVKVGKKSFSGSLLFAHRGVSGPAILNASLYWSKGEIEIDFLPNFELFSIKGSKKSLSNLLPLPKSVAKAFLSKLNIDDKNGLNLSKDEFKKLEQLKSYKFAPAGTFGYSKAEVTKGGIDLDRIENFTFESKLINNLYFLGEVLDVTGELGGYNFHFAFSSALSCAKYLNDKSSIFYG